MDNAPIDVEYAEDVIDDNGIHIPLPSLANPKDLPPDRGDAGAP